MKDFFNHPNQFSFKDMLAIAMCAPFLGAIFLFLCRHVAGDLDLIKTLVPVIITVLGGYFSQEVATAYFTRGNTGMGYGMYGGYGYGTQTTIQSTNVDTTPEQGQEGPL